MKYFKAVAIGFVCIGASSFAQADTIDPISYATTLEVGETSTIRKTVVVEAEGTSSALIDVMFIIDTTGSMGDEIASAKAKVSQVLTNLSAFGDLQSGTGFYDDPTYNGVLSDLTGVDATTVASINSSVFSASGGGDFEELTYAAIKEAADDASWRVGSNRYIIVLGDASNKEPATAADTEAALLANNIDLIGVSFSSFFADSITAIGGAVFDGGSNGDAIATAISDGIASSFADYSTVDVSDLGGGMPGVGVSSVCVSADTGSCTGTTASGVYDRSVDRTFEFDVTFTALEDGVHAFDTFALVDGSIVATEADIITVRTDATDVPEPTSVALFSLALLGIVANRRKMYK